MWTDVKEGQKQNLIYGLKEKELSTLVKQCIKLHPESLTEREQELVRYTLEAASNEIVKLTAEKVLTDHGCQCHGCAVSCPPHCHCPTKRR